MSLLPVLLSDPFVNSLGVRRSRIMDQHFGLDLNPDDLLQPLLLNNCLLTRTPAGYLRNWRSDDSNRLDYGSTVSWNKEKFELNLDVQQFKPDEISLKYTGDNEITIEGKHEEKEDEHGWISRHFVRKYILPKNYDIGRVESNLSSDGVLTITAPAVITKEIEHKIIPITQTGIPAKQEISIEQ